MSAPTRARAAAIFPGAVAGCALAGCALACCALVAPAQGRPPLPPPTGPHSISSSRFEWTDESRPEVADLARRDARGALRTVPASGARRVIVRVWYPAVSDARWVETAPYNAAAASLQGVLRDTARLALYGSTFTHATENRPVVPDARFPLVVFSPGSGMFAEDYTALLEDIASHGFIVAAIAHPGVNLLAFGDGSISGEWPGWRPPRTLSMSLEPDSLRRSWRFFKARDAYLAADVLFVIRRLMTPGATPLWESLDTARVGVFGHSTGGAVAAAAATADERTPIRALLVYDVILPGALYDQPIPWPFMLMRTTATHYPKGYTERQLETYGHLAADGFDVRLLGAAHQSFTDRLVLSARTVEGADSAALHLRLIGEYSTAFFARYLKLESVPLLDDTTRVRTGLTLTPFKVTERK